jgi:hypothetical protein
VPKGKSRIAAYDKSQWMVNEQIRKAIEEGGGEGEMSKTEKIITQVGHPITFPFPWEFTFLAVLQDLHGSGSPWPRPFLRD